MSMIDPKGSRQELEAMAIIRAHRAQNRLPEASAVFAAQPAPLIMLPIPGFWESLTHHIHAVSPENKVQVPGDPVANSIQMILP
jgi:hypothetical protein